MSQTRRDPGETGPDGRGPGATSPASPAVRAWRTGVVAGVVGMLCCVGPAVLALLGVVGAGTAFAWATDLYDGWAWAFRLAGLAVLVALLALALRRRDQCSVAGVRRWRARLLGALAVAVGTYVALYAATTWLGTLAPPA